MWALFTSALTRASSTTRVSIINTSVNFLLTAFSGWLVFGEELAGLWWVGAAGLIVGNVVIGRRDEDRDDTSAKHEGHLAQSEEGSQERYTDRTDAGISDGVELLNESGKSEDGVQR